MTEKIYTFSEAEGRLRSTEWRGAFPYRQRVVFWDFQEGRRTTVPVRYRPEDAEELLEFLRELEEKVGTECLTSLIVAWLWPRPKGCIKVAWGRNNVGFGQLAHELAEAMEPGEFFLESRPSRGSGWKNETEVAVYEAPTVSRPGKTFSVLEHWERPRRASWNGGRWRRKGEG